MPQWNTTERGKMREEEDSYFDSEDWDGKSCADYHQLPGRGIRDVESLTMLSGLSEYDQDEIPESES